MITIAIKGKVLKGWTTIDFKIKGRKTTIKDDVGLKDIPVKYKAWRLRNYEKKGSKSVWKIWAKMIKTLFKTYERKHTQIVFEIKKDFQLLHLLG